MLTVPGGVVCKCRDPSPGLSKKPSTFTGGLTSPEKAIIGSSGAEAPGLRVYRLQSDDRYSDIMTRILGKSPGFYPILFWQSI